MSFEAGLEAIVDSARFIKAKTVEEAESLYKAATDKLHSCLQTQLMRSDSHYEGDLGIFRDYSLELVNNFNTRRAIIDQQRVFLQQVNELSVIFPHCDEFTEIDEHFDSLYKQMLEYKEQLEGFDNPEEDNFQSLQAAYLEKMQAIKAARERMLIELLKSAGAIDNDYSRCHTPESILMQVESNESKVRKCEDLIKQFLAIVDMDHDKRGSDWYISDTSLATFSDLCKSIMANRDAIVPKAQAATTKLYEEVNEERQRYVTTRKSQVSPARGEVISQKANKVTVVLDGLMRRFKNCKSYESHSIFGEITLLESNLVKARDAYIANLYCQDNDALDSDFYDEFLEIVTELLGDNEALISKALNISLFVNTIVFFVNSAVSTFSYGFLSNVLDYYEPGYDIDKIRQELVEISYANSLIELDSALEVLWVDEIERLGSVDSEESLEEWVKNVEKRIEQEVEDKLSEFEEGLDDDQDAAIRKDTFDNEVNQLKYKIDEKRAQIKVEASNALQTIMLTRAGDIETDIDAIPMDFSSANNKKGIYRCITAAKLRMDDIESLVSELESSNDLACLNQKAINNGSVDRRIDQLRDKIFEKRTQIKAEASSRLSTVMLTRATKIARSIDAISVDFSRAANKENLEKYVTATKKRMESLKTRVDRLEDWMDSENLLNPDLIEMFVKLKDKLLEKNKHIKQAGYDMGKCLDALTAIKELNLKFDENEDNTKDNIRFWMESLLSQIEQSYSEVKDVAQALGLLEHFDSVIKTKKQEIVGTARELVAASSCQLLYMFGESDFKEEIRMKAATTLEEMNRVYEELCFTVKWHQKDPRFNRFKAEVEAANASFEASLEWVLDMEDYDEAVKKLKADYYQAYQHEKSLFDENVSGVNFGKNVFIGIANIPARLRGSGLWGYCPSDSAGAAEKFTKMMQASVAVPPKVEVEGVSSLQVNVEDLLRWPEETTPEVTTVI